MALENSFIPRAFGVTDSRRRQEELARKQQALDGASRAGASTIPPGGTLRLEGGIEVQGGNITVRDKGEMSVIGDGVDRYTHQPVTVTTSFGNREVLEPWTGISVLRPGLWLESSAYPTDPANVASLTSRYGDSIEIVSLTYDDGSGAKWRSSANVAPAGAWFGWSRYEGDPTQPTTGGTSHSGYLSVSVDAPPSFGAYQRNAPAANPAVIHTNADLELGAWGGQVAANGTVLKYEQNNYDGVFTNRGSLRFDQDGLMALHSEKGSNKVDITHNGDGVLNLSGSARVNVNGTFTVNGSPVGGAVTSVAGKTGAVVLSGADIPAATTSAQGAMTAADKSKLNGLGAESIINALSPAGWSVGGSIFVEPLAGETKITLALLAKYTGASVTVTTTAYSSMGTVLPPTAISATADSPYLLVQVVGAGLNNQAIAYVNLSTGAASLRAVGTNFTLASGALFTISCVYKR